MFQLIVSIIAIALVAVLAAASIFYGGDAFTSGTAKANASASVNVAQQVAAAWTLYRTDTGGNAPVFGAMSATHNLITSNYMQGVPSLPNNVTNLTLVQDLDSSAAGDQNGITMTTSSSDICLSIQKAAVNGASIPTAYAASQAYGCYGSAAPYTIFYKR